MTKAAIEKLRDIPLTKRIELVDGLIYSIALDQRKIPVTRDQKEMIDERLLEIENNPGRGVPLAKFRKQLGLLSRSLKSNTRRKSA